MTRPDDIINLATHRLSTGEVEEVLAAHPDVAGCAVFEVADALKGQVPLGLPVLKAGTARPAAEIEKEAVQLLRDRVRGELQDGACRRRPTQSPRAKTTQVAGDDRRSAGAHENRQGSRNSRLCRAEG